jgi:Mlc titration factor MtfA (ptsG expression regulator)
MIALLLRRWLAPWAQLTGAEQERMVELTEPLVHELRWEAANGFEVTDDMRVAIAGHAAMLVLAFDDGLDSYLDVTSVIVHPSTIVHQGVRHVGNGLFIDGEDPVIGEAHHRGPVLVSWDAAAQQALEPWRGESVLFHEFAHRLDMLDGMSDGTPPLDDEALAEWVTVCTRALAKLRAFEEPSVLRSYATTNPAEFFAVATEVFFTRPVALREENAALYGVLRGYFRQDPASRRPTGGAVRP